MTPSAYQPERPESPFRCHETFPSDPNHHPEEDLGFIRETALAIADRYVSPEIAREHREILVARVAVALVRNGAVSIKQDPDSGFSNDCLILWDDSVIARSLGYQQDTVLKDDSQESARKEAMRTEERATAWLALKEQMCKEGWADEDGAGNLEDRCQWRLKEGEVTVARGGHKRDADGMECGGDEGEGGSKKAKE